MKIRGTTITTPMKPESVVVKCKNLTEEEQAQARDNIGLGKFVVTLTPNPDGPTPEESSWRSSHTSMEIAVHIDRPIVCISKYGNDFLAFDGITNEVTNDGLQFYAHFKSAQDDKGVWTEYIVDEEGAVTFKQHKSGGNAVLYTAQELTPEQQAQSRENIGAVGLATPEGGEVFNDTKHNQAGYHATAFGSENRATGSAALAAGSKVRRSDSPDETDPAFKESDWRYNEAIAPSSTAIGRGAVAYSIASKSLGYRTQTGYPPNAEEAAKRKEDVVLKKDANGNVTYPANSFGQAAVAFGSDTAALANNSFSTGWLTRAYGDRSFVGGTRSEAHGVGAFAIGNEVKAMGNASLASGWLTNAIGNYSYAFGRGTSANKDYSSVFGMFNTADADAQTTVGKYNAKDENALFIVGNGTGGGTARKNAFVVKSDGSAFFAGKVYANGNQQLATQDYVTGITGDIETALDRILAIQNVFIGGDA